MRRPSIDTRLDALRASLLREPDPTHAARRLMSIVADPAFRRDADSVDNPRLAARLWTLLGRIGRLAPGQPHDAPIPMERYAPAGVVLGFVPIGLRPAPFVYFEADHRGLLVAPGRGAASHHRFTLAAEAPGREPGQRDRRVG